MRPSQHWGLGLTLPREGEVELSRLLRAGRLRFEVTSAASVRFDRREFGTVTEGSLPSVAPGSYPFVIQRPGYPEFATTVRVPPEQELTLRYAYNFANGTWVAR